VAADRTGHGWLGRGRTLGLVTAMAVTIGLMASSCLYSSVITPLDPRLEAFPISDNRPDSYGVAVDGDAIVTTAAATNTGGNGRILVWPRGEEPRADQEVCATWRSTTFEFSQQGIALRLRFDNGLGQAILITKNVWAQTYWNINVSQWRASDAPQAVTLLHQFDLSEALGRGETLAPLPWRMCARVVGATVGFVVWPLAQDRPAWNDPRHSGEVPVPDDLMAPGVGGWFVGHLQPGQGLVYDDLSVGAPEPDPA